MTRFRSIHGKHWCFFFNVYMTRKLLSIVIFLLLAETGKAQINFSDSLQISLLTCSEGPDAYERFGHSAVRILDQKNDQDIVFHWGVFNFNAPHFVWRFVKGETDYQLGATYTQYFIEEYAYRGLSMKEQILNLDKEETKKMTDAILTNYLPQNRVYRYSYFFDNCATRPFNIINSATENTIKFDTTWVKPITLRDMLQEMTYTGNWLDFGISLAVANRADHQAYFREQMFLPEYLATAYNNANLGDKKFVKEEHTLLEMQPEIRKKIDSNPFWANPLVALIILGLILVAVTPAARKYQKTGNPQYKWGLITLKSLHSVILLITGIAGLIIWFLNFFSVHPSVDHNINCLILLPTNIIFAALIWIKRLEKVNRIYFFIIFAAIIAYFILNIACVKQYFSADILALCVIQLIACNYYYMHPNFGRKKIE